MNGSIEHHRMASKLASGALDGVPVLQECEVNGPHG